MMNLARCPFCTFTTSQKANKLGSSSFSNLKNTKIRTTTSNCIACHCFLVFVSHLQNNKTTTSNATAHRCFFLTWEKSQHNNKQHNCSSSWFRTYSKTWTRWQSQLIIFLHTCKNNKITISNATICPNFALAPKHEQDNKPNSSSSFTPIKQWKKMTMMCV